METTLTQEQKQTLRQALDFDITRYLIANSCQVLDGNERAERHMNISKTICGFIFNIKPSEKYNYMITDSWLAIHDYLADVLTDRMDEIIGFPVFEPLYNVDTYKEKFFDVVIKNFNQIENIAKESLIII